MMYVYIFVYIFLLIFSKNLIELCLPYGAKDFYDLYLNTTWGIVGKFAKSARFLDARKHRGRFYVVAFITAMGAVQCYDRRNSVFTSKIILLYGRISIRFIGENSGNATDAKDINVDRRKIERTLTVSISLQD